ncbi:hypothetical protein [Castellaniella ginsengisoli]|uniref:Lipoprotein n=1 Tax=Castellaniella ginsengisoli TaxID=546114 RepID=A0AB39D7L0_9BURK
MRVVLSMLLGLTLAGCGNVDGVFTLYRNSPADAHMRIHVATFDSTQSPGYNEANCGIARDLFQSQPGVLAGYWCEKGRFHE